MEFEWNEIKREVTLQERGLDFRDARHLFDGRPLYSYPSPRADEDRVVSVGRYEGGALPLFGCCGPARGGSFQCGGREMARKSDIVRYSTEELGRMTSNTDWVKVDSTTREQVERQADADDGPLPEGWEETVVLGVPGPKRGVYLRLDPDVLDWFKDTGKGYQTRINRVLRAFVESRKHTAG